MKAIVRIFFRVEPDEMSWEELLKKYADAAYYMQFNATLIADETIKALSKALENNN